MKTPSPETKKRKILEIAGDLAVEGFTPAELEQIRRQLVVRMGAEGKTTLEYIAEVLEEAGLRAIGYGPKVDEFVLSMNRAAEKAAPAAKEIFWTAIKGMSFEDARKILSGGDTAATDYFREKTTETLTAAFRPVVTDSMKEVGVIQQYKQLQGAYQSVPFASSLPSVDIEAYVVGKALDGLFLVLGEEERKIRTNPAAQVTSLLKKVFGK